MVGSIFVPFWGFGPIFGSKNGGKMESPARGRTRPASRPAMRGWAGGIGAREGDHGWVIFNILGASGRKNVLLVYTPCKFRKKWLKNAVFFPRWKYSENGAPCLLYTSDAADE